jgi:hypothetical protein
MEKKTMSMADEKQRFDQLGTLRLKKINLIDHTIAFYFT